jgi:putative hydrolase of the HAD superfamily
MIKYILVDVHGVLTKGDEGQKFALVLKNIFKIDPEEQNNFWRNYVDKLDKNQISSIDYLKFFNQKFNTSFTPDEYYSLIVKQIIPNLELLQYLSNISNKYKIVIVSDNLFDLADKLENVLKNDFGKYQKFYSYQYGLTKKGGLLSLVLKELKVDPQNCIFTDDNQINIEVAKNLGINALLFENNQKLFTELDTFLN